MAEDEFYQNSHTPENMQNDNDERDENLSEYDENENYGEYDLPVDENCNYLMINLNEHNEDFEIYEFVEPIEIINDKDYLIGSDSNKISVNDPLDLYLSDGGDFEHTLNSPVEEAEGKFSTTLINSNDISNNENVKENNENDSIQNNKDECYEDENAEFKLDDLQDLQEFDDCNLSDVSSEAIDMKFEYDAGEQVTCNPDIDLYNDFTCTTQNEDNAGPLQYQIGVILRGTRQQSQDGCRCYHQL